MKYLETGNSLLNMEMVLFIEKNEDPISIKFYSSNTCYLVSRFETKEDRDEEYEKIKTRVLWPESYGLCP